jgi:hypothetical protein
MKKRILLILSLIFSVLATASAQTRTVTNSDLEKFREKRVAAEKDYRENYAKLGFPSPQELAKQIADGKRETEELSARLEAERLEREKNEAQLGQLGGQNVFLQSQSRSVERNYYGYYNLPRYRGNYDWRSGRYWRNNNIPPIRPPKPIRPPRVFGSPNFRYKRR